MDTPSQPTSEFDKLIEQLRYYNTQVAEAQAVAADMTGARKALLEEYFDDITKPSEMMGAVRSIAEKLRISPNQVMKWLGEQINRGDVTIVNDDQEVVGSLQLADIFRVGEEGTWQCIDVNTVVWHMATGEVSNA